MNTNEINFYDDNNENENNEINYKSNENKN